MRSKQSKTSAPGFSRREFLLTVGATAPTISLMEGEASGVPRPSPGPEAGDASGKFTPIKLSAYFNSSCAGIRNPRKSCADRWGFRQGLPDPRSRRQARHAGNPLCLGARRFAEQKLDCPQYQVRAHGQPARWKSPVGQKAHFLCLTSFCDFDENESPEPGKDVFQKVGQRLADVTLIYEDNGTHVLPIRRRFETNAVLEPWGHLSFAAMPPGKLRATKLTDPLRNASRVGKSPDLCRRRRPGSPRPGNRLGVRAGKP